MRLPSVRIIERSALVVVTAVALLAIAVAAYEFVAFDRYLRHRFWVENRADPALWNMVLYSGHIAPQPNTDVAFAFYGINGRQMAKAKAHVNNLAMWSDHDYQVEKKPTEYRVLVLGGEQTASSVVDRSWPDLLEIELRRRDPSTHYVVINCAWPDAGPEHYIDYWLQRPAWVQRTMGDRLAVGSGVELVSCSQFNPDLTIVNYPESDFFRNGIIFGALPTYKGRPIKETAPIEYGQATQPVHVVDGTRPSSFADINAIPSRPYGMFAPESVVLDPIAVSDIQRRVVEDMIAAVEPDFGSAALSALRDLRPIELPLVSEVRNFDPSPSAPIDKQRLVEFGVKSFGWMVRNIPNVMLVHTFNYPEAAQRSPYEFTAAMMAADPEIKVKDARDLIPPETSPEELASWFMTPFMAEKLTQKGHYVYASMMAELVLRSRSGTSGPAPK